MGTKHLVFGKRIDFVKGFDVLLGEPILTMEEEAGRTKETKRDYDEALGKVKELMQCKQAK